MDGKFALEKSFVQKYKERKPNFGFNGLGELTFYRTYSRLKPDGTNEDWSDCVERVVNGTYTLQKRHIIRYGLGWDETKAQESAQEMFDRIWSFKFTPPGRGLWAMGTDIVEERGLFAALNNPLHEDTKILTREHGWVALKTIEGSTVTVLSNTKLYGRDDGTGKAASPTWAEARISNAEMHPTVRITYKSKFGDTHSVVSSLNHRWFRRQNTNRPWERVTAEQLSVGDFLPRTAPAKNYKISYQGAAHGYFFGDGTRSNGELHQFTEENRNLLSFLFPSVAEAPNLPSGLSHEVARQCPIAWGKPPSGDYLTDQRYVYGFLAGYFAADGSAYGKQMKISSARQEELSVVASLFHQLGIRTSKLRLASTESNYSESRELWEIYIDPVDLHEDFFLKPSTKKWFVEGGFVRSQDWLSITEIQPLEGTHRVLCATVPEYEQFVTEGWALTSNCAFTSTEKLAEEHSRPFRFLMDMSMLGVGVGFDVKGAGKVLVRRPQGETHVVIPDTREGWVDSVGMIIDAYLTGGPLPTFDYSVIRPAGTPIKTFGGVSSGYEPLKELHTKIKDVLEKAIGSALSITDITDIMNLIGVCVVAGNVRRTAEIVFGPATDEYMDLKNYAKNPQRMEYGWTSNNSIFAEIGMDYSHPAARTALNGEPGYEWLSNAQIYGRMKDKPNYKDSRAKGGNPCVTADTWVMTEQGPRQVIDLIGQAVSLVVNGASYEMESEGFWYTGDKEVFRLSFADGRTLRVTANHKILTPEGWVEAQDLSIGDEVTLSRNNQETKWDGDGKKEEGYLCGLFFGDGSFQADGRATLCTWEQDSGAPALQKRAEKAVRTLGVGPSFKGWGGPYGNGWHRLSTKALTELVKRWGFYKQDKTLSDIIESESSSEFVEGFLCGLFDADGSVQGTQQKGVSVRLHQADFSALQAVQRMLGRLGINSTVYKRGDEQMRVLPDGLGGKKEYLCKAMWDLVISKENLQIFADRIGFTHSEKAEKLKNALANYKRKLNADSFTSVLIDIISEGVEPVYDVTVRDIHAFDANGIIVHNCLEQTLEDKELCCLVETFITHHDSIEDYNRTLKFAYLYAKTVTLGHTHWVETNRVMMRNRRIGLSQSGIATFVDTKGIEEYRKWCEAGYQTVQDWDEIYSEWLAVPRSIKTTSVKPSGTVSLLAGVTPGMHFPESHFYIRRIRISNNSNLLDICRKAGYNVEQDAYDSSSSVVEIPVSNPANVRTVGEVSMWEQVALSAFIHKYWADNQVSCTVSFKPEEADQIQHALNYFQYDLKGISFLPKTEAGAYVQMPYEAISQERYEDMLKTVRPLDFSALSEDSKAELFCTNDSCEIK